MGIFSSKPKITCTQDFFLQQDVLNIFETFIKEYCIISEEITHYINYWEFCSIFGLYISNLKNNMIEESIRKDIDGSIITEGNWQIFGMNFLDAMCKTNRLTRIGKPNSNTKPALLLGIRFKT